MRAWDTIVIGSGSGGLTAAVALARAGQRVLVLEQHYLPGGFCQSFSLSGYRFSPGVHYLGELGPGGGLRRLYEGLGLGDDLEFCEMNPEGYDHFLIEDERFDVPKGFDRWFARLCERFPHEREGLRVYFDTCHRINADVCKCDRLLSFPEVLTVPFRAPSLIRWGFRTQKALLDKTIKDPMLRAVLSAQSGNHGLAPSRVSLPLHASMSVHYDNGAYYPRGGAKRIPLALIRALRRRGGQIRLRARVQRILVERGRAVGVELGSGERIQAQNIISNADPAVTFGKLLPPEHGGREREKAQRAEYSVSMISVFGAVDLDLRRFGYDSGNYWWYRRRDVGALYERMERSLPGAQVDGLFLAITTLKDPSHRRDKMHTIEMFTFVPYAPFARWKGTAPNERGPDYERLKESLGDKMVAAAENVIPGLGRAMRFRSVASPLSNDFYCETPHGCAYGTAKTPWQMGPFSFSTTSSVEGLYSCGASTLSHGVAGTAMTGLAAAAKVLHAERLEDLLAPPDGSIRVYPSDRPEEWLDEPRRPVPAETEADGARSA
ncbi:Phytoene desaturase, neurosporene or lycopene producing [Minicystis rosea]|nr:Phytoene desaturase, neurosporene or lycopene producing [Minicystis rosea]